MVEVDLNMAAFSNPTEENLTENQDHDNVKLEVGSQLQSTQPEVLCDSCMDSPSKAVRSCMTCLVSYCDAHLRPHLEKAKFQTHTLVDPLHEIDCEICEVHRLPLTSFCLQDGCCVCLDCESQEHGGHQTQTLEAARTQIEVIIIVSLSM